MSASLHRRSTASARLRENRPQSSGSSFAVPPHRRKSRSPESRNDEDEPRNRVSRLVKQKRAVHPENTCTSRPLSMIVAEEERGRKAKYNNKSRSQPSVDVETTAAQDTQSSRRHRKGRRRDRSLEREATSSAAHAKSPEPDVMDVIEERLGSGTLAAVDYTRMRDEIDALRKVCYFLSDHRGIVLTWPHQNIAAAKKTINKQTKVRIQCRRMMLYR